MPLSFRSAFSEQSVSQRFAVKPKGLLIASLIGLLAGMSIFIYAKQSERSMLAILLFVSIIGEEETAK